MSNSYGTDFYKQSFVMSKDTHANPVISFFAKHELVSFIEIENSNFC